MKTSFYKFTIFLSLISIIQASCEKTDNQGICFDVKIHSLLCAQTIMEIQDPSFHHLGEDGWKHENGNILNNVFKGNIGNCDDLLNIKNDMVGKIVKVQLMPKFEPGNCAICEALLIGPKTEYFVKTCK